MSDPMFQVGADGIDTEKIVADIRETVARKLRDGAYNDARVARAERTNLCDLKDDEAFLEFYFECLREAVFVDISDFEIHERRRFGVRLLVAFKRLTWKLLKFYTYRLWSQQNDVNGLLLSAIEGVESKSRRRLEALEKRIAALDERA